MLPFLANIWPMMVRTGLYFVWKLVFGTWSLFRV